MSLRLRPIPMETPISITDGWECHRCNHQLVPSAHHPAPTRICGCGHVVCAQCAKFDFEPDFTLWKTTMTNMGAAPVPGARALEICSDSRGQDCSNSEGGRIDDDDNDTIAVAMPKALRQQLGEEMGATIVVDLSLPARSDDGRKRDDGNTDEEKEGDTIGVAVSACKARKKGLGVAGLGRGRR